MEKAFVSWSGGKDCTLAAYRAANAGFEICGLLNMVRLDGKRSWSHGIKTWWLEMQATAMNLPLMQVKTSGSEYEAVFKNTLAAIKQKGIGTCVFGDIDFEEHYTWINRVCNEAGITPVLPLWGRNQNELIDEFIAAGFEARIVATNAEFLGKEWLGRRLDKTFLYDLMQTAGSKTITPCGEAGEYHTLVLDGPMFGARLEVCRAEPVLRENHWFWDIRQCRVVPREEEAQK